MFVCVCVRGNSAFELPLPFPDYGLCIGLMKRKLCLGVIFHCHFDDKLNSQDNADKAANAIVHVKLRGKFS